MSFCLKKRRCTKSSTKKKVINLESLGVSEKESIVAENCGESSFQQGLSHRDR